MRTNGTKYDEEKVLPEGATPVSLYAKEEEISSPAYVHVKFDRFKFGYTTKAGKFTKAPNPGYKIISYKGSNYVVRE
jgi:hypothetical protein